VIELQMEKAGVRLAYLLNAGLEVKWPGVPPALLWRTSRVSLNSGGAGGLESPWSLRQEAVRGLQ
jgi:hypothetical protein